MYVLNPADKSESRSGSQGATTAHDSMHLPARVTTLPTHSHAAAVSTEVLRLRRVPWDVKGTSIC
jgi:hypothetical protein